MLMKRIFLSNAAKGKILLAVMVVAALFFLMPYGLSSCLRKAYASQLNFIGSRYAIVQMLGAALPLAVLPLSRKIMRLFGKYGLCALLLLSMTPLLLWVPKGYETIVAYQGLIAFPLMIGATLYGFFSPQKIMLPRLYTPLFFLSAGLLGIIELINVVKAWFPSGMVLNLLLILFFACLQAGQANILRHRLQRQTVSGAELHVLILNYALIFAINFCGLLLSAHAMKICLAFAFDNLAAKNAYQAKSRSFS